MGVSNTGEGATKTNTKTGFDLVAFSRNDSCEQW